MNYINESDAIGTQAGLQIAKDLYVSRTIGENIDDRISSLKSEITRLENVKNQLTKGASLLDVKIDDLRRAMNY